MKKLFSLMVIAAAAFAGGGMMNEHNLTTAVNYLYHKQQVGSVISLGSITNTPPAALPDHLPTVPGAVSPNTAATPAGAVPGSAQPPVKQEVASSSSAAAPLALAAPSAVASPVPASPPPPLSVDWPDRTSSTYHATPTAPASPEKAQATAASQPPPTETLPPPAASPAPLSADTLASASPVVPPPSLAQQQPGQMPKADAQITRAGYDPTAAKPQTPVEPTWPELMRKLQAHGVGNIALSGTTSGKLKLRCELPSADGRKSQAIEAEGDTPMMAAQVALKRVVLFNAARRASKSAAQAGTGLGQARSAPVASQGNIPQFTSQLPPASVPPPPPPSDAPLPAPADVPN